MAMSEVSLRSNPAIGSGVLRRSAKNKDHSNGKKEKPGISKIGLFGTSTPKFSSLACKLRSGSSATLPYRRSMGSVMTCAAVISRPVQLTKKPVPTQRSRCSPRTLATTGTMLSPRTDCIVPAMGGPPCKTTISLSTGKNSAPCCFGPTRSQLSVAWRHGLYSR